MVAEKGTRRALGDEGRQETRKASPQKQLWRDIGIHMHDSVKLVGKVVIINGQAVSRAHAWKERGWGGTRLQAHSRSDETAADRAVKKQRQ